MIMQKLLYLPQRHHPPQLNHHPLQSLHLGTTTQAYQEGCQSTSSSDDKSHDLPSSSGFDRASNTGAKHLPSSHSHIEQSVRLRNGTLITKELGPFFHCCVDHARHFCHESHLGNYDCDAHEEKESNQESLIDSGVVLDKAEEEYGEC